MKQIELLQGRVSAALEEISAGIEQLGQPVTAAPETSGDAIDPELFASVQEQLNAALEATEIADQSRAQAEAQVKETQDALESAQTELATLQSEMASAADSLEENGASPELLAEMQEALDGERATNAQLQDDISVLNEKIFALETELATDQSGGSEPGTPGEAMPTAQDLAGPLTELDSRLYTLQASHEALIENNAALRQAAEAGLADAGAINTALQAELESVNAARAVDQAEARAIYAALAGMVEPTFEGERSATEGEVV